jgi:hypothetical protein
MLKSYKFPGCILFGPRPCVFAKHQSIIQAAKWNYNYLKLLCLQKPNTPAPDLNSVFYTRGKTFMKIRIRILSLIYLIKNLVQYTLVKILNPVYCSGRTSLESVIQSNDSSFPIKFSVISFFDSQHCFFSMKSHLNKPSKTLGWFVGCKIGGPIRTMILLHKS